MVAAQAKAPMGAAPQRWWLGFIPLETNQSKVPPPMSSTKVVCSLATPDLSTP